MEVIVLETEAFYALIDEVVSRVKQENSVVHDKWITTDAAMDLLKIKSKTTLQTLRNDGKIRYSQPVSKIILYDRDSILDFLDQIAVDTF
jgi:hypothetical protein